METSDQEIAERKANAEALLPHFSLERVLNTDQMGRRITLLGSIESQQAIVTIERAALPTDGDVVKALFERLVNLNSLQSNDIFSGENNYTNEYVDYWYLSNIAYTNSKTATTSTPIPIPADLKLNLIYPCTPQHIKKYSSQRLRWVTETPEIYQRYIRPYMHQCRLDGRLDWIFNILDGRAEQDEIILRLQPSSPPSTSPDIEEIGFILSPDLNWDRRTLSSLHLLAIPNRRDIWSLRDLRIRHLPWLLSMRSIILDSATRLYGPGTPLGGTHGLERDELKLYVHYQPTYYHFHIHVVHVMCEAGSTQSVGKAVGFDSILDTLRVWKEEDGCGGEVGMDRVSLSYHVGERSEVWEKVFGPLKEGRAPVVSNANTGGGGR